MSVQEVQQLFLSLNLEKYCDAVEDAQVDMSKLKSMGDEGLATILGMSNMTDRLSVMRALKKKRGMSIANKHDGPVAVPPAQDYMQMQRNSVHAEEDNYTVLHDANIPAFVEGQSPQKPKPFQHKATSSSSSTPTEKSSTSQIRPPAPLPSETAPYRSKSMISMTFETTGLKDIPARELSKEGVAHAGWIQKRGDIVKNWKLRWLILKDTVAVYYVTPEGKSPKGAFDISEYRLQMAPECNIKNAFKLVHTKAGRTWYFSCESSKDMNQWIQQFEKAIAKATQTTQESVLPSANLSDDESDYDDPYDDALPDDPVVNSSDIILAARPPVKPPQPERYDKHLVDLSIPIQSASFYFKGIDRTQTELLLKEDRSFLVRQKNDSAPYVISVLFKGLLKHYKIFYVEGHGYSLGGDESDFFPQAMALVRHYQLHSVPNSTLMLGRPFKPN